MNWQPIETYDALKKKPVYSVFFVAEKPPTNGRSYTRLRSMISVDRYYGSRNVTHWMPLPDPPTKENNP